MTSRFKPLAPDQRSEEQQKLAALLTASPRGEVRGPYIPLMYSPDLADRMRHLGDFIRFGGALPAKLKEIVILLNARRWSVAYMFAIHRDMSRATGLDPAIPDAIAKGERPAGLTREESVAYDVAQELLLTCRVSDASFTAARDVFGEQGVIELVAFVGYYTALAMILNTAELPPPEGAPPLPELSR
jgi:4-carboxymuconolactone decarboxylase